MNDLPVTSKLHTLPSGHQIMIREAGSGPAVVFIHGSGPGASGLSNFRQNYRAFVEAGFRVLLPDLIGYGASSKPTGIDYTLDLFADTLYQALELHGVNKAHLVGNSLGGGIAIQMALDHPTYPDRLVLMGPGCVEDMDVYMAMPGIARMRSDFGSPDFSLADQRRLITNIVHDPVHVTDDLVAERHAVAITQPKDVLTRMRAPNLAPRLGELRMPILGFWGLEDQFLPESGARRFLQACPNVRFMTFTRVGHWVQLERAEEFNRYSIDFLKASLHGL